MTGPLPCPPATWWVAVSMRCEAHRRPTLPSHTASIDQRRWRWHCCNDVGHVRGTEQAPQRLAPKLFHLHNRQGHHRASPNSTINPIFMHYPKRQIHRTAHAHRRSHSRLDGRVDCRRGRRQPGQHAVPRFPDRSCTPIGTDREPDRCPRQAVRAPGSDGGPSHNWWASSMMELHTVTSLEIRTQAGSRRAPPLPPPPTPPTLRRAAPLLRSPTRFWSSCAVCPTRQAGWVSPWPRHGNCTCAMEDPSWKRSRSGWRQVRNDCEGMTAPKENIVPPISTAES